MTGKMDLDRSCCKANIFCTLYNAHTNSLVDNPMDRLHLGIPVLVVLN